MAKEYLSANPPYVIVVKNDTLSEIAEKYGLKGYIDSKNNTTYGTGGWLARLVDINDITNANRIVVGQKIILSGTSVKKTNNTSTPVVKAFGLQSNTDRTVYATWTWSKSNTENYRVIWTYDTGNGVWFIGNDSTTTDKQSIYNAPQNAKKVRFKVLPVSKTKKVNNKETKYWTASWSSIETYSFVNNPPVTPSGLTVSMDEETKTKLTASLQNVDTAENGGINAKQVQFRILRIVDGVNKVYKTSEVVNVTNGGAQYTLTVSTGYKYLVQCRSTRNGLYSDWSDTVEAGESAPAAPAVIKECSAVDIKVDDTTKPGVYLEWAIVPTAVKYRIQWALDDSYFDIPNLYKEMTTNTSDVHTQISDITNGETWYFRVQAINSENAASKWSPIKSVTLGDAPDAPTTWSSKTTAMADENDVVYLYWIHNSKDESDPTKARVELTITKDEVTNIITTIVDYESGTVETELRKDTGAVEILPSSKNGVFEQVVQIGKNILTKISGGFNIFPRDDVTEEDNDEPIRDSYMISASNMGGGTTIDWRVSTAGIAESSDGKEKMKVYGPWSASRTVQIYNKPTVELDVRDYSGNELSTMYQFPINFKATPTADSSQGPIGYYLEIISQGSYDTVDEIGNVKNVNTGAIVYSKYFDTNDTVLDLTGDNALSANDMDLENNIEYLIRCTVAMSSGLTCSAEHPFTVAWNDEFYEPNAEIVINSDNLTASIRPYCEYEDGTIIENVELSVYRREFDGSFTEIETRLPNTGNVYVTDPHPSLDYARYRIIAKSKSTGAISKYDVPGVPVDEKGAVIQWDEEWSNFNATFVTDENSEEEIMLEEEIEAPVLSGSMLKLPYNVDISEDNSPEVELIKYIGRKHPVSYYGTHIGQASNWSMEVPKDDKETLYALRRLAIWMGDVYVRESSGIGHWANITVSFSKTHNEVTIPVTINVTRVEGGK